MPLKDIEITINKDLPDMKPVKEVMGEFIPDIDIETIPRRNGLRWVISGAPGSGKTYLALNFFKNKQLFRGKFHNIYYFCPEESMLSVHDHPFEGHDKVYHEVTLPILTNIYNELVAMKEEIMNNRKMKGEKKEPSFEGEEESKVEKLDTELKYNCIFFDDMACIFKEKELLPILKQILTKSRHICTAVIFTLQSYLLFPKQLRKLIDYITIFKPENMEEWSSLGKEKLFLSNDDSLKLYDYVFDEKYNHMTIDNKDSKYYKNFNELKLIHN